MMKKIIIAAILVSSLAACKSVDPYTGEEKFSSTSKYALGGAAAGAIAGQIIGKDTKGTLIGAAAGALIGSGVGAYVDKQETELRQELSTTGVSIKRTGDKLELVMPGNLTFRTGSSDINSNFYDVLDSVGEVLTKYDQTSIFISGHTDNTGSLATNQRLSKERAQSVAKYLSSRGVLSSRMDTQGFDSQYPIASNNTAAGREQNRRVEIEILTVAQ